MTFYVSDSPILTPRRQFILNWMIAYQREHGCPPTLVEIGKGCNCSKVTAYGHVLALEKLGKLEVGEVWSARRYRAKDDGGGWATIPVVGEIDATC